MERGRSRGHGSGLAITAGCALVAFWVVSGGAGAGAVEAPIPVVTIAAVGDGSFTQDSPGCGPSSRSLARGELEVRRTGSTAEDLVVDYLVESADAGDFDPPSGTVTIPAGAAAASILISPRFVDQPGPLHVHRSAILDGRLLDGAGYDVGGEGEATISLRFDVDIEPCVPPTSPPTTPPTTPAVPTGVSDPVAPPVPGGASGNTATLPATGNPATLPFTGAPVTAILGGVGSALVALGGMGMRYGRPRARRRRSRV
jgi:hypothetical protein